MVVTVFSVLNVSVWYSTKRASGAPCVGTPSINLNVMLGVPFSMFTAYQFLIGETGSRVEGTVRD